MNPDPNVPLRELFDVQHQAIREDLRDLRDDQDQLRTEIRAEIASMREENTSDHNRVVKRLERIEGALGDIVTWRSLGFALTTASAGVALIALVADRL